MSFHKWPLKKMGDFLFQTGECLADGYPLYLAVMLQTYEAKPHIKAKINQFLIKVREGTTLDKALKIIGIPDDVCQFIFYAGESGNLSGGFIDGGKMLLKQQESKDMLQKVLKYPLFLFWIFCLLFFFLTKYLFPNFVQLYHSLSIKLPLITRILLAVAKHLNLFLFLITLIFTFIGLVGYFFFYRLSPYRRFHFLIHVPVISGFVRLYLTQSFAYHIGILIQAGLTLNQTITIVKERKDASFLQHEVELLHRQMMSGGTLSRFIETRPFYLKDFCQIIYQGEQTGMLGESLTRYGLRLLKRIEQRLSLLFTSIQPAFLVIVGSLVLLLFLSIMLPVFNIMNGL